MQDHGLDTLVPAVGLACIVLWSLTARRLAGWNVSSAMAMVLLGLVVANPPLDLVDVSATSDTVLRGTEPALVLVLFSVPARPLRPRHIGEH